MDAFAISFANAKSINLIVPVVDIDAIIGTVLPGRLTCVQNAEAGSVLVIPNSARISCPLDKYILFTSTM